MQYNIPTKSAGELELPVLGFGTWQMGGNGSRRDANSDDERDIKAIRYAVKSGLTHIDTAEIYADGWAEQLVGEAIKDFDRDKLFITTKVSGDRSGYDNIIGACQASLKRLGTDYADLYLIHWPNQDVDLKQSMQALDTLYEEGLVKHIGVSNFHVPLLKEAQSYAKYKIVNNQIHYALDAREYARNSTAEHCREYDILITAYRPVGKGALAEADNQLMREMVQKYEKTPAQIAINWVMNKPGVVTLFKSSNPDHIDENLGALGWRLEEEDEKRLDEEFPVGKTLHAP